MTVEYLDLTDYLAIAAEVTGLEPETVVRITDVGPGTHCMRHPPARATSTFYPDFVEKAAVLAVRLAKNHPLPDGNKRAVWIALRIFIEINRWSWTEHPSVDDAEHAVLSIAAGEWSETEFADWLRRRLSPPSGGPLGGPIAAEFPVIPVIRFRRNRSSQKRISPST